jgi:hypothetical protein
MVEQSEREEMMVVEELGRGSGGQECPPSEGADRLYGGPVGEGMAAFRLGGEADILGRCLRSDFCA